MQKKKIKKINLMAGAGILSTSLLLGGFGFSMINTKDSEKILPAEFSATYAFMPKPFIEPKFSELFEQNTKTVLNPYSLEDEEIEPVNVELTNEEKKEIIKIREKLTESQFHDIVCTMCGEGGGQSYEEVYNVTTTLLNHKRSRGLVRDSEKVFGENTGNNLFALMTVPGHFVAYSDANYDRYNNLSEEELTSLPGYQAVIDVLYENNPTHNYIQFRSPQTGINGEQLTPNGNIYFSALKEDDIIAKEEMLAYAFGAEGQELYGTSGEITNQEVIEQEIRQEITRTR